MTTDTDPAGEHRAGREDGGRGPPAQVILVTGGSRGVGAATARPAAERGSQKSPAVPDTKLRRSESPSG